MANWTLTVIPTDRESTQAGQKQLSYQWNMDIEPGLSVLPPVMNKNDDVIRIVMWLDSRDRFNLPSAVNLPPDSTATLKVVGTNPPFTLPNGGTWDKQGEFFWWPSHDEYEALTSTNKGFGFRVLVVVTSCTTVTTYTIDPEMVVDDT